MSSKLNHSRGGKEVQNQEEKHPYLFGGGIEYFRVEIEYFFPSVKIPKSDNL